MMTRLIRSSINCSNKSNRRKRKERKARTTMIKWMKKELKQWMDRPMLRRPKKWMKMRGRLVCQRKNKGNRRKTKRINNRLNKHCVATYVTSNSKARISSSSTSMPPGMLLGSENCENNI